MRWRWKMCQIYGIEMDDPWFKKDPLKKLWYYESFRQDLEDQHKFQRDYAIFAGSFTNMEMAQKLISEENPDYASTDEDFAESTRMVLEGRKKAEEDKSGKRKRRRKRVVNG